eukprot:scaffold7800_cov113-Isochrysis_galbana.AAC.3
MEPSVAADSAAIAAASFSQLDSDTLAHVASFLSSSEVLALDSVCREWSSLFRPPQLALHITRVSLHGTPLGGALRAFSRRIPTLSTLSLRGSDVDGRDVRVLCECYRCLTELDLSGCDALQDVHVARIGAALPQLQKLCLNGCRDVSDAGLAALLAHCRALHSLELSWCDISDAGLVSLAAIATSLTALDLSGCAMLTDRGVAALMRRCPRLASIHLEGCREVSGWALATVSPRLRELTLRCEQRAVRSCRDPPEGRPWPLRELLEGPSGPAPLWPPRCRN